MDLDPPLVLSEPVPSYAQSSTSSLTDAPAAHTPAAVASETSPEASIPADVRPGASPSEDSITVANAAPAEPIGWDAAISHTAQPEAPSQKPLTPAGRGSSTPLRGPRGGKRASLEARTNLGGDGASASPGVPKRGRGGGRPRGRGRGGGRGGKRKREDKEDEDDDSDSSEIYTPAATQTKSGRAVQKPTTFAPPPPASPTTGVKRKRTYRRNPESAVCKVCLRGTSPASNMIVFCDGCNTPYHRFCHHPPIDQAVIDEVDKEWYCRPCEKEKIIAVPESEIASFVSAGGASQDERQKYFSSLAPGMLVTLLTKASSLNPDLPLFAPGFQSTLTSLPTHTSNALDHPPVASSKLDSSIATTAGARVTFMSPHDDEDGGYGPDEHPAHYPRPGQGLMSTLPPEQDDLQWLVDDSDRFGVFNHLYQVGPAAPNGPNGRPG